MAEVAGLTASIIAIAGAAGTVVKSLETVKDLNDRHDEVHGLINEISDLRLVLQEIGSVIREDDVFFKPSQISTLSQILDRAKQRLLKLDEMIHYRLYRSVDSSGGVKTSRLPWFTEKSRLKKHQDALVSIKSSLATILSTMNVSGSSRIALMVNEVSILTGDMQASQEDFRQHATDRFSQQEAAIAEMFQSFCRYQAGLSAQGQVQEYCGELCKERVPGTSKSNDSLSCDGQSPSDGGSPSSSACSTITYPAGRSRQSLCRSESGLRLQTTLYQQTSCGPECSCICHTRNKIKLGNRLRGLLGTLFIGYSGSLVNDQPCNERSCLQRSKRLTQFTYYFPSWFLARMFSLIIMFSSWDGPEILLRFPRVISVDAAIMDFARCGNVDGMKRLFSKGLASPHDVSSLNGYTVLHYAASNRHSEACRFLIAAGADPYLQNDFHNCAIDFAWDHVFRGASSNQDPLVKIFYNIEVLETRQFSFIHKIVLGITQYNRDLKMELHESTSTIDVVDSQGRTAISWAAQRGDAIAVETLLDKGANPNISDIRRRSALHYAAKASSPGCLRPILATAGVDVNQRNIWQQTALHSACHNQKNRICIDLLMGYGADPSARDMYGKTPMDFAAEKNSELAVAALLEHGANVEDRDDKGWTALYWAITSNAHRVIRLLLASGSSYNVKSNRNESILHAVTSSTGVKKETIELLASGLLELDLDAKDIDGRTARNLLAQRDDVSPELSAAYEALLVSLEKSNIKKDVVGMAADAEEFTDISDYTVEPLDWRLGAF